MDFLTTEFSAHISATTAQCVQLPVVPLQPVELVHHHHHVVDTLLPPPQPSHAPQTTKNTSKCFQNRRKSSKDLVKEAAQRGGSSSGRPPSPTPPPASHQNQETAKKTALHTIQTSQTPTNTVILEGPTPPHYPCLKAAPAVKNKQELLRPDRPGSLAHLNTKTDENVGTGAANSSKSLGPEKPCDQLPSSCVLSSDTSLKLAPRKNSFTLSSEKIPNRRRQCQSKVSILEEVLSWRRTANQSPPRTSVERPRNKVIQQSFKRKPLITPNSLSLCFFRLIFFLISFNPVLISASEFPQRECCDNPLYKFDPPPSHTRTTFLPPRIAYPPPEVPDFPEYGPEVPHRPPDSGNTRVHFHNELK